MDARLTLEEIIKNAVDKIEARILKGSRVSSDFYYNFPDFLSSETKSRAAQEVIGRLSKSYPRIYFSEVTGSVISVNTEPQGW